MIWLGVLSRQDVHSAVFLSLSKDVIVPEVISTHVYVFLK